MIPFSATTPRVRSPLLTEEGNQGGTKRRGAAPLLPKEGWREAPGWLFIRETPSYLDQHPFEIRENILVFETQHSDSRFREEAVACFIAALRTLMVMRGAVEFDR